MTLYKKYQGDKTMKKNGVISILVLLILIAMFYANFNISVNALIIDGNSSNLTYTINSPNNIVYYSKKVQFNISASGILAEISYINLDDPNSKWKTLCTRCSEFGFSRDRRLTMVENLNHLILRITYPNGSIFDNNITLRVESTRPKIHKIFPRENAVTNGTDFSITYSEKNLLNITLVYGNDDRIRNVSQSCTSGNNQICKFSVNLTEFENENIYYNFLLKDYIDPVNTRMTRIKVDTITPVLNIISPVGGNYYFKKLPLNITVSEKVKIVYKDVNGRDLPWRTLCTNCESYGYYSSKYLNIMSGNHDIYIKAIDDAGNSDMEKISFVAD